MRVELHEALDAGLTAEWWDLYAADPVATPFISPGWVHACWRHYPGEASPWLLAVRSGARLVGLAPFSIRRRRGIRTVSAVGELLGDYWDILAVPADRDEVLGAVARELANRAGEWDELALNRLPGDSATTRALMGVNLPGSCGPLLPCPGVELPATFDDYVGSLPHGHRSNIRRHLRRLDQGEVVMRSVTDPGELAGAVRRWHELRLHQWAEQERPLYHLHADDRFRAFIADVVRALVPAQRALLWEFHTDERLIGSYLNLVDPRAFYWYLGGYDPGAAALGVGKIAIGEGIRTSIVAGRSRYDFLRGTEPYKYWYGARDDRRIDRLTLRSRHPRTRVALAVRRTARRMR